VSAIPEDIRSQLNARPDKAGKERGQLGQQDFLDLMIAQVMNQDPFSPMQNGEFIAQLAQFSMAEGIENMQATMTSLSESMTSSQLLSASALVGRSVLAPSDTALLDGSGGVDGAVLVDEPASSITVNVSNSAGALVARIDVEPTASGPARFSWNGRDMSGAQVPPGEYRLAATAMVDGQSVAVQSAIKRDISSITLGASSLGDVKLNLDNGSSVKLSSVQQFF
jgi:flagellar basal-body rod modification protein FlgD